MRSMACYGRTLIALSLAVYFALFGFQGFPFSVLKRKFPINLSEYRISNMLDLEIITLMHLVHVYEMILLNKMLRTFADTLKS